MINLCWCLKKNGVRCQRPVSMKPDDNYNFCWQHQNCKNSEKITNNI